jgi:pimeloyl-ACP methyl ester carboxylesterase
MLVNPGGPGVPGTELIPAATSIWPKDIRDRFDIVAWDPRGTGGSAPVDCVADVDRYFAEPDPSPDTPAEKQELVDRAQEFDDACEKADGPMLAHISTVDTANDLERIRQALGEDTITYFGFSYGSELGATYATLFGKHIRAMVLDGAIDPDLDGVETAHAGGRAERARLVPRRLLFPSRVRVQQQRERRGAFDTLMAKLDSNPLPPPEGSARGQAGVALNAVIRRCTAVTWPSLAEALNATHARRRRRAARAQRLVPRAQKTTARGATRSRRSSRSAASTIRCRPTSGLRALAEQFAKDARALGRSFAYGFQCAVAGAAPTGAKATSAALPRSSSSARRATRSPPGAEPAARRARSSGVLLVREGEGHTAYGEDKCVDDAIDAYILDLTVPADGTRC